MGQTLVVDVRLEPVACPGPSSDELDGTVDYGWVVDVVRGDRARAASSGCSSAWPAVIADALWDALDLVFLEVAVTKPAPPVAIPVEAARVEVVRTA